MRTYKEIEDLIKEFYDSITKTDVTKNLQEQAAMAITVLKWVLGEDKIKTFTEIEKDPKAWNDWIQDALK